MKMIYLTNIVCLFVLSFTAGFSQSGYHQIVDTAELSKAELINLKGINTEYLEFSPSIYGKGIVYVSSMPQNKKKKVDQNINESFFTLRYSENLIADSIFDSYDFLKDLQINNHAGPCAFSDSNTTLILSRNNKNSLPRNENKTDINPMGIYIYKNQNGFWVYDSELPVNSYGYKVFHPTWDEAGQRLIFASDMPGGFGETDLYSLRKTENGWIDLKNLGPEINTRYHESWPFIYRSQYLFFSSDKPGGSGAYDLYFSPEISQQFQKPINLQNVFNSEFDDFGIVLSENPALCYFTSNRPGGKGKDDIYMLKSSRPVFRMFNDYYTLSTVNSKNGEPLSDVKITFSKYELKKNDKPRLAKLRGSEKEIIYTIDSSSIKESKAILTDKNGIYNLILPEGKYIIKAIKQGYLTHSGLFETDQINKLIRIEMSNEILDTFSFSFMNGDNNEIISDVSFDFIDGQPVEIGKSNDNIYFISIARGNTVKIRTNRKRLSDQRTSNWQKHHS